MKFFVCFIDFDVNSRKGLYMVFFFLLDFFVFFCVLIDVSEVVNIMDVIIIKFNIFFMLLVC